MKDYVKFIIGFFIFLGFSTLLQAQDFSLSYFLNKANARNESLSAEERKALLHQMERLLTKTEAVHQRMMHHIKTGALEILYQEGEFWVSKMTEDGRSIQNGFEGMAGLKKKPLSLLASVNLYKSLRDLAFNFNAYNNIPAFSGMVGDLAPELALWADPVFYQLYLLPLVRIKDVEKVPSQKERTPPPKTKKPS